MRNDFHKTFISIPTVFVALTLLFSLGLHSIQISHNHPGHHAGEQQENNSDVLILGEYMHVSDKKLFIILSAILLLGTKIAAILYGSWSQFIARVELRHLIFFRKREEVSLTFFDCLQLCLCRGILHPKLH